MIEQLFANNKIVPVVVVNEIEQGIKLAEALLTSGINTMEITLRTTNALAIIRYISDNLPEMIVGAGTVLNSQHFVAAQDAGAKYIISPGMTNQLIDVAQLNSSKVSYIPGICTPSQAMEAADNGLTHVKFFPAEPYNAYAVIKALASPLPHIKFCPTGGITVENMGKYLELPNIFAVGLSSIVDNKLISSGDYLEIRRRSEEAIKIMQQYI